MKANTFPLPVSASGVCLPDHILKRHLHCPYQCLSPPCQQPGTGCPPSVLLPISYVLAELALPVSFSKSEGNETENLVSNKNETTLSARHHLEKLASSDCPSTAPIHTNQHCKQIPPSQGWFSLVSGDSGGISGDSGRISGDSGRRDELQRPFPQLHRFQVNEDNFKTKEKYLGREAVRGENMGKEGRTSTR